MPDDIPSELTPREEARRKEADRVWGWRYFEEDQHNAERLRAWWERWVDVHPSLWALGRHQLTEVYAPHWKWQHQ